MEQLLERGLFASRWILAPFYVGLIGALMALLYIFCSELYAFVANVETMKANDAILACLALVDISLAANLLVIVAFSGYENSVSKIDVGDEADQPSWKGKVDFTGLKIKLVVSIIAISGIHLLKVFMDITKYTQSEVFWMVMIHLVFMVSGLLLALTDYLIGRTKALSYGK